jgi:thioredoxin-like negative regulator of GroEL
VLDANLKKAGIDYEAINVADDDERIDKYHIRSVPTLIKEDNGEEVDRFVGIMNEDQLKTWCDVVE